MPGPEPPSHPDPPSDGAPGDFSDDRLDGLLADVPGDDDRLSDLVAARTTGTLSPTDRAEWARLIPRMDADAGLRARVDALTAAAERLMAARPDPAAHFEALVAAASKAQDAGQATAADEAPPVRVPERAPRASGNRTVADRAPSGRVREARPRWRVGVLAALALLVAAVGALRVVSPRSVDPSDVAPPEALRSAGPGADDPQAAYDRAAAHLARAERSVLGISFGVDAGGLAAARASLDTVLARTPADAALHLDALYLRGVACEAGGDRSCAQVAYAEVVGRAGPRADRARAALERLAR